VCLWAQVAHLMSEQGMQMRRHAIRVESHLVDRAMLLLQARLFLYVCVNVVPTLNALV